jgi:4-hydroxy-tetrahydrodipicolinate reductase
VLVGAVDSDPGKVGRPLREFGGFPTDLEVTVTDDIDRLISETRPELCFHATGSRLEVVHPQIAGLLTAGLNVISTCEELSFPFREAPRRALDLDEIANRQGVSVLATGVNPGFLMDTWPLFMTGICQRIDSVRVARIQDATVRRLPFQLKIGAGRSPDEFDALVQSGSLRHVGLPESIAMLAAGLDWNLTDVTEEIRPVIAEKDVAAEALSVRAGEVAGVHQVGRGFVDGDERITLEFQAFVGASRSYDSVRITGIPDLEVVIEGGTHGDLATAAIVVNAARRVLDASPGLLTMKDLAIVACGLPRTAGHGAVRGPSGPR